MVSAADETYNPGFFGWTVSADSAETGKKHYLPRSTYRKDGNWHMHYINITVEPGKPMLLKGNLYDHNENSENCYVDAMIREINLGITGVL